ncbi:MAG: flagellar FlbD family protein [Acidimicrobiales bacterium]
MIRLTRLNGGTLALNPDLIERIEVTPDTVITLIDGTKYVVGESLEEIIDEMVELRARGFARAQQMLASQALEGSDDASVAGASGARAGSGAAVLRPLRPVPAMPAAPPPGAAGAGSGGREREDSSGDEAISGEAMSDEAISGVAGAVTTDED